VAADPPKFLPIVQLKRFLQATYYYYLQCLAELNLRVLFAQLTRGGFIIIIERFLALFEILLPTFPILCCHNNPSCYEHCFTHDPFPPLTKNPMDILHFCFACRNNTTRVKSQNLLNGFSLHYVLTEQNPHAIKFWKIMKYSVVRVVSSATFSLGILLRIAILGL
jgi:hypothetical protein